MRSVKVPGSIFPCFQTREGTETSCPAFGDSKAGMEMVMEERKKRVFVRF